MLSIYLFFLSVKMIATVGCALISYRIARKKMTPTATYMLFTLAYITAFITQTVALMNANSLSNIISMFDKKLVVLSQCLAAGIFILMLTALIRILAALKVAGIK